MKINEVLTVDSGIFAYIKYNITGFTFAQLDLLFITKYGEREISPIIESLLDENKQLSSEKRELLGSIIYNMFSYNWDNQNTVLTYEFNPIENYYEVLETTRTGENTNTTNTDNNTFAFNSIESVDRDNTNQTSESGTNETIKQTKKGLQTNKYSDMVESALKVKSLRLIDIVFNDVKWFISLNLYK